MQSSYLHMTFDDPPTAMLYQQYAPAVFAYVRQHTPNKQFTIGFSLFITLAP